MAEIRKYKLKTKDGERSITIASGPVILQNKKVLLVRKKGGEVFQFPGGTIFDNESFIESAVREVREELNIEINITSEPFFYFMSNNNDDYLLVHYLAEIKSGKPQIGDDIEEFVWAEIELQNVKVYDNVRESVKFFNSK